MADKKITQLTALDNSTIDVADVLPVVDVSGNSTDKITYANLMAPKSSTFRVVDSSDLTKKLALDLSGITTATTRTLIVPNANTTIVGTDTTQTIQNKTIGTGTKIDTSGSDGTGSIYYRDSGGNLVALPPGAAGTILDISAGGLPEFIPNPAAADATYTVKGVRVLDANAVYYGADAGSTDAYAITLSPAPGVYVAGQVFTFKANTVNTGPATLNVNSLGAKTIVKGVNTTLTTGDIAAGQFCTVIYDGTNFVLQNPVAPASSSTFYGIFKNSTTTKDASDASTVQNIPHGLGIIPKKIRITAQCFITSNPFLSLTVYNGTTQSSQSQYNSNGSVRVLDNTFTINVATSNSTQVGVVTFDATNIIITWTKSGSPTGVYELLWEAEA